MREFNFSFTALAGGIVPTERNSKRQPRPLECHNLEPVEEDYVLHELVVDLNADSVTWSV